MNAKLDAAQVESHATILSQNMSLNVLVDGVKNANSRIEAGNSILAKVSEALKFDRIRQLGAELKGLMRGAMAVNFATYRAVIRLESALPSHLERILIEDPVILEDPIGRIAPVHLQFITSWDAFHSVLDDRFQNVPGESKMRQRKYGLQIGRTGKETMQSQLWQHAFLPGQRVEMSFVFADRGAGTTCPGCSTPSNNSTDETIHCAKCQMHFCRIQEVRQEHEQVRSSTQDRRPKMRPFHFVNGKRPPVDLTEYEDDIRNFKRVRLVKEITVVSHSDDSPYRGRKPNRRPTGGDWALIRAVDPNRPDIAQRASSAALNSDTDTESEADS